MSSRSDVITTALVLLSFVCAVFMFVLFATGEPYWGTCAGIGACYALLLAWFFMEYARGRR